MNLGSQRGMAIMVQGCTSDAGKSLISTALCRYLSNQGIRVAPFKAQNMSNNSRVVAGGEIGTAQWLQAKAARVEPTVQMNPVLLKPQSDTKSQFILHGKFDKEFTEMPWKSRSAKVWPQIQASLDYLLDNYEVVVIEGAGSPAETNLFDSDFVNMRVAQAAHAKVLLVVDIDRGGAFAHLYGTYQLLPPKWQQLITGFLLNKFRGDPELLHPAPQDLESLTGVPTVGVVPKFAHDLPNEEGPSIHIATRAETGRKVQIVCGPYSSNLDEFALLQQSARVSWIRQANEFDSPDLLILPGSKNSVADLAWMRSIGIDSEIKKLAEQGVPILGICGGMQILGNEIVDEEGIESPIPVPGLGLLNLKTNFAADKEVRKTTIKFPHMAAPWQWLSETEVDGYEIHFGESTSDTLKPVLENGLAYAEGNILGTYVHGLFENDLLLKRLSPDSSFNLDSTLDLVSEQVIKNINPVWLEEFIPLLKGRRQNDPTAAGI